MSYLVLARRWRPQLFEQVLGQRPITQTLQNAIQQKRVAHAFLFTGARGVGKTSTARILAKALNCERGPDTNPCNTCTSCREISAGVSMDVIEIDGASNRGIDEIRELRENVRYTPAKSRYKIYIIDEVHMLTREAFNALLKTLEEPPPHIIFIFATTEPHKIPTTILSRCQRYDFKRIPLREIVESLTSILEAEKVTMSRKGLFTIARESEGSMRDAQSLLDRIISYAGKDVKDEDLLEVLGIVDQKILLEILEAIARGDVERCLELVDHVYRYGIDVQHFCRELLQFLRHLILIKVAKHPESLIDLAEEELAGLKKLAERFQANQLDHLFNLLLRGEEQIAQSSFPRTMLEMTLIRMATLHPVVPIEAILKKLEGLGEGEEMGSGAGNKADRYPAEKGEKGEKANAPEVPPKPVRTPLPKEGDESEHASAQGTSDQEETSESHSQEASGETWKELVNFVRARNPVLGSFLVFGDLMQLTEERIEIGFEKDSFHYERMLEPENSKLLEQNCCDCLNKKVALVISPLGPRDRPKGQAVVETGAVALEGEREKHSLVQEAMRLFDGRIVEK